MVMPGDNVELKVELIKPIAMEARCVSPSAKAAAPSVQASSRRSSSKAGKKGTGSRGIRGNP